MSYESNIYNTHRIKIDKRYTSEYKQQCHWYYKKKQSSVHLEQL